MAKLVNNKSSVSGSEKYERNSTIHETDEQLKIALSYLNKVREMGGNKVDDIIKEVGKCNYYEAICCMPLPNYNNKDQAFKSSYQNAHKRIEFGAVLGKELPVFWLSYLDNINNLSEYKLREWLRNEIEDGNTDAEYICARIEYAQNKNRKTGAEMFEKLAEAGNVPSMFYIGKIYSKPNTKQILNPQTKQNMTIVVDTGVNYNIEKTIKFMTEAYDKGYTYALAELFSILYYSNEKANVALEIFKKIKEGHPILLKYIDMTEDDFKEYMHENFDVS